MKFIKHLALTLITGLFALNALAASIEIADVVIPDSTQLQGTKLRLNGAGIRYKAIFKVYVAALYLPKKATTPDEVINQPGPKRMTFIMKRGIDSAQLGKLLTRGMEDNMGKAAMSRLIPGLIRMGEIFAAEKPLVEGDTFGIDWVPGVGTSIIVKGKVQGVPFKEPEFFKALLMIWLGPVPADAKLKDALLAGGN